MSSFRVEDFGLLTESMAGNSARANVDGRAAIRHRFERILTGIEILTDGITVAAAVFSGYAAYHFLHIGRRVEYSDRTLGLVALGMAALVVLLLDRDGAYRSGSGLLKIKETERALRVSAQAFLLVFPATFFSSFLFSRWFFAFTLVCVPAFQILEKQVMFAIVCALRSRGFGAQRVLIYGAGYSGRRVFSALARSPKLGLNPVVLVDDNPDLAGQEMFEYSYRREHSLTVVLGPITKEMCEQYRCEFVVIAIPSLSAEKFARAVQAARAAKARLAFLPDRSIGGEYWTERADIDGMLMSVLGRPRKDWHYDLAKRTFDLLSSLALIVLLAPVWLLFALWVHMDSPGEVLFRQKRVGKDGRLFDLYKFRSMYIEAPKYAFSPLAATDPRITRAGRFLRRTSLDELPQLINVVKGDMSLVGPRPEMPFIVEQYTAQPRQRLQVKPGITGLWQLSADRAFQIHENIQYDLYYIRNRSFFMDLAILLHTAVFAMRGV